MSVTNNRDALASRHATAVDASEELLEVTGGGLRIVELVLVALIGLLACPPLFVLAVVVAVPAVAVAAVCAAIFAAIAVPTVLVRRVRAHHHRHGTTMFVHRLLGR